MLIEDKKELKIVLIITVYKIKESLLSFISKYWVIKNEINKFSTQLFNNSNIIIIYPYS